MSGWCAEAAGMYMCKFAGLRYVLVWMDPSGRMVQVTSRNGFDLDGSGMVKERPRAGKSRLKEFQAAFVFQ